MHHNFLRNSVICKQQQISWGVVIGVSINISIFAFSFVTIYSYRIPEKHAKHTLVCLFLFLSFFKLSIWFGFIMCLLGQSNQNSICMDWSLLWSRSHKCRQLVFSLKKHVFLGTRMGWKVHRMTQKELCHSNETWHALNSTFTDTSCIVSFQINPHWINIVQDFEK